MSAIRRNSFILLSLLLTSAAFAQQFRVLEVSPASGPSTGGTVVRIRMNQLPDCPILPIGPSVSFGGVAVSATTSGDDTFIATAPAHAPGQVDLVISACGMEDLTVKNGFSYFQQSGSQDPFRVLSITPASGPITGGTAVTIQLDDIPFCTDPVTDPGLIFGGIAAPTVGEDYVNNTITAITPAHPAGTVSVVVMLSCGGPPVTLQSGFTYNNDADPNPAYEKVLFPVFFFGSGAHGSQWATRISVYNAGQSTVTVPNPVFFGDPICPAGCGCGPLATIPPGATGELCGQFADPAGLMFYAPEVAASDLHYHARAFDTSRATENAGTEIPTVREHEFRTDPIVLLNLPLDDRFRLGLRIYNPDQHDGAQVKMQVLSVDNGAIFGERTFTLDYPIVTILPDPWPNRPAYVNIGNLHTIVREILGTSAGSVPRFHIKLTPVTAGIRFWAFATITNNETQLITTVSPQN
ncbi:MAG: IPT/TIG domain-containing protein [Thermoanaerobaculia bacterium]